MLPILLENGRICDHLIEVGGVGRGRGWFCGDSLCILYMHAHHSLKMSVREPPIPQSIGTEERSGFWGGSNLPFHRLRRNSGDLDFAITIHAEDAYFITFSRKSIAKKYARTKFFAKINKSRLFPKFITNKGQVCQQLVKQMDHFWKYCDDGMRFWQILAKMFVFRTTRENGKTLFFNSILRYMIDFWKFGDGK
jgi:hypothetical protein